MDRTKRGVCEELILLRTGTGFFLDVEERSRIGEISDSGLVDFLFGRLRVDDFQSL